MNFILKNNSSLFLAPLFTIILIFLFWWFLTFFEIINPLFLPKLNVFFVALFNILSLPGTYANILSTIYRAFMGLFFSALVSIPLGLIFGRFEKVYKFFEFPTDFFRSIPSSSLFPLFILIFGIGNLSKIGIVFYGCSLILLLNTVYGAKPTKEKQDRINMLKSFKATPYQVFKYAILRDALPQIAAGIRVCISLSFVLVIVAEMFLGSNEGIGKQIYDYYLQYNIPEMYSVIVILGIIGYFSNKFFLLLERKFIFWLQLNDTN